MGLASMLRQFKRSDLLRLSVTSGLREQLQEARAGGMGGAAAAAHCASPSVSTITEEGSTGRYAGAGGREEAV